MFEFKEGDTVYCPSISSEVLVIEDSMMRHTPWMVRVNGETFEFTKDGRFNNHTSNPAIFPANSAWYRKLSSIYDLKPPKIKF